MKTLLIVLALALTVVAACGSDVSYNEIEADCHHGHHHHICTQWSNDYCELNVCGEDEDCYELVLYNFCKDSFAADHHFHLPDIEDVVCVGEEFTTGCTCQIP